MPTNTERQLIWLIGLFLGLQALTTDLYLPMLPELSASLHADMAQGQLTLSVLLVCFGTSQIFWGTLADHFGRKPILLWGITCYGLSALCAMFTSDIVWLILWRGVQGVGLGAAVMCARAIIRDCFSPARGARVMAIAMGILGIIACLSPVVGGILAEFTSWHAAFVVFFLIAVTLFLLTVFTYQETAPKHEKTLALATVVGTLTHILKSGTFWSFTSLNALSYGGLFIFLIATPYVLSQEYGESRIVIGQFLFLSAIAYILGTLICRRIIPKIGLIKSVQVGGVCCLTAGVLLFFLLDQQTESFWSYFLPHTLYMVAHGILQPCSQSCIVAPFPLSAGSASALSGFIMMVTAFILGQYLALLPNISQFAMAFSETVLTAFIALIALLWIGRHSQHIG